MKLSKSWWILFIVSLAIMIPFAAPYFTFNPEYSRVPISSPNVQFPLLVAHIALAFIALLSGFFQLIEQVRLKKPILHRYLGRIYVASVLASGLLAVPVIIYEKNYTKAMSFLTLDVLWLFTAWKGYRYAAKKQFPAHREWIVRSFAVTLAPVSARALVPVLILLYVVLHGFALPDGRAAMIEEVLNVNAWAGLILDLAIVEWVILRSDRVRGP